MITISDVKKIAGNLSDDIKIAAPPQIMDWLTKIIKHPGTPWFFLGTGIEALGITIQYQFFEASFPILDFIVGFALFAYLAWWQLKQKGGDVTDATEDSEEGDEDGTED